MSDVIEYRGLTRTGIYVSTARLGYCMFRRGNGRGRHRKRVKPRGVSALARNFIGRNREGWLESSQIFGKHQTEIYDGNKTVEEGLSDAAEEVRSKQKLG